MEGVAGSSAPMARPVAFIQWTPHGPGRVGRRYPLPPLPRSDFSSSGGPYACRSALACALRVRHFGVFEPGEQGVALWTVSRSGPVDVRALAPPAGISAGHACRRRRKHPQPRQPGSPPAWRDQNQRLLERRHLVAWIGSKRTGARAGAGLALWAVAALTGGAAGGDSSGAGRDGVACSARTPGRPTATCSFMRQ